MTASRLKVARLNEIPTGSGRVFRVAGRQIAVFAWNGSYFAIDNVCPHRGGPLGEGSLTGSVVQCPLHRWRFDVTSGRCVDDPARRVACFPVHIEQDDLFIELPPDGVEAAVSGRQLLVRYGAAGYVGRFQAEETAHYERGCRVVIETSRGVELGDVLVAGPAESSAEQFGGTVLRAMNDDDAARARQLGEQQQLEFELCRQRLAEQEAAIELVDAERLLDGRSLILYFLGEATPLLARISEELSNRFDTQVQFRPFFEAESAGCGSGGCGSGGACHREHEHRDDPPHEA